jgi:hypothetical protein
LEVADALSVVVVDADDAEELALATITAGGGGGGGGAACFFGDFGGRFGGCKSSVSEFSPPRPPDEDMEAVDSAGVDSHLCPGVNVINYFGFVY